MYEKFFVGLDLTGAEDNGKQPPISRVTLLLDDENSITAGDDTGSELMADCPHATQAMVNAILAQVKGCQYQMYSAENANLDPSAELGDGVTVDGIYSVISRIDDDGSGYAGLSAPGESELEDEYPSSGPMTQAFNRKIAQTNSKITKTAEQIRLEVLNEVTGLSASIDVKLGSITSQVTGLSGQVSSIKQQADGITSQVDGLNGQVSSIKQQADSIEQKVEDAESGLSQTLRIAPDGVTITNASGSTLTIDGGQIDASKINAAQLDASKINAAQLDASKINAADLQLTGSITFGDLDASTQASINGAYNTASSAASTANIAYNTAANAYDSAASAQNTVSGWQYYGTVYFDGSKLMAGTVKASSLQGGAVYLLDSLGDLSGLMFISAAATGAYAVDLYSYAALRLSAHSGLLFLSGGPDIAVDCDNFYPMGKAANLGNSNLGMWDAVYSYTSEIVTSDRNKKSSIEPIPDKYMDMIDQIRPVRFKINNGASGRYHIGFIAQDVEAAMEASGISPKEFAGWCKDKDADGNEIQMLRYTEFIALYAEKFRRLETRVDKLEGKMS